MLRRAAAISAKDVSTVRKGAWSVQIGPLTVEIQLSGAAKRLRSDPVEDYRSETRHVNASRLGSPSSRYRRPRKTRIMMISNSNPRPPPP